LAEEEGEAVQYKIDRSYLRRGCKCGKKEGIQCFDIYAGLFLPEERKPQTFEKSSLLPVEKTGKNLCFIAKARS